MRIALFGRTPKATNLPYLELVLEKLVEEGVDFAVYHTMVGACDEIKAEEFPEMHFSTFADEEELENFDPHFLISLGGDGTILDATVLIQNKDIPILGINICLLYTSDAADE